MRRVADLIEREKENALSADEIHGVGTHSENGQGQNPADPRTWPMPFRRNCEPRAPGGPDFAASIAGSMSGTPASPIRSITL